MATEEGATARRRKGFRDRQLWTTDLVPRPGQITLGEKWAASRQVPLVPGTSRVLAAGPLSRLGLGPSSPRLPPSDLVISIGTFPQPAGRGPAGRGVAPLGQRVHVREAQPPALPGGGSVVTRASLQADLLAARERAVRLAARVRQLEHRLSGLPGEQAWRESGLGQADDIGQLRRQVTRRAEDNQQLRSGLAERDQDLAAARAANRELMARLNTRS
jgi:hypothetical protein